MRTRVGNPSGEAHGQPMRCYDWLAPAGTTPEAAITAAETALGVKLRVRGGEAHGFLNTSLRPGGSLYVCVHLYDFTCDSAACECGEGAVVLRQCPDVGGKLAAMVAAVGEHPIHRLGGDKDAETLKALGFATADEKLTASGSKNVVTLDGVSARCAECGTVAFTDGPLR